MDEITYRFFMGANSRAGFCSLVGRLAQEDPEHRLWTLKSGPGCGKSTALARLAQTLGRPGEVTEELLCSGNPQSLDGVVLRGRGLSLVDGTAPHAADPELPGACGGYITFPPFLDLAGLEAKAPRLRALKGTAGGHYTQAYLLLEAACRIEDGLRARLEGMFDRPRLLRRAEGIIARELPRPREAGRLRLRFLDGVTPDGLMCLWDTVAAMAGRAYLFEDTYGLAEPALAAIRDAALARGLEVYACMCPKDPQRLRHVLLPGPGLAFVTAGARASCPLEPYRRVRVDAYIAEAALRPVRGKLRLLRRTADSLVDDAVGEIAQARDLHRQMEALYRPHLDFEALDRAIREAAAVIGQGA